jgi:hypothetical protein
MDRPSLYFRRKNARISYSRIGLNLVVEVNPVLGTIKKHGAMKMCLLLLVR